MSKIRIDSEELRKSASSLNQYVGELAQLNVQLENLIQTIGESWTGKASDVYVAMMNHYLTQGRKVEVLIQQCSAFASDTAVRFDEHDRNAANLINHSF